MRPEINRKLTGMLLVVTLLVAIGFLATPIQAEIEAFGHVNAKVLQSTENTGAEIVLTEIPLKFYRENEEVTVRWEGEIEGVMRYSRSPGGGNPANYPHCTQNTGTGSLTFRPGDEGMGVGLYYCLITSTDGTKSSVEFKLIVESAVGVTMNSPVGEITSPAPIFSWQANPGVPLYLIAVSDQPFVIEKSDGEQKVKGVNAIWMAITPDVSIQYGQPDPSGNFTSPAPPLLAGKTYNWIVLNNYGNTLSTTSDVTSTPKDFWLAQQVELSAPQNMYPEAGDTLNYEDNRIITFQWSQVPEAVSYHIYLSEYREVVGGSEGFYPVWDAITSDPLIDLGARYLLIDAKYTWKVIAEDADGNIAASDTTSFWYQIPISTLDIWTTDGATEQVLPYTTVKLSPIDGSVDITPILMDDSGHFEKIIPTGTYTITTEKTGYQTQVDTVVLTMDPYPDPNDDRGDIRYEARLFPSPAQFYGTVVDSTAGDIPVEEATVELTSADQTVSTSTLSDANGNFSIGVSAGEWQIVVRKTGYSSLKFSRVIEPGENLSLDSLKIAENKFQIFGTAVDHNGNPLWGVTVKAENDEGTSFTHITDAEGNYAIKVSPGWWTITATKTGYVSPKPQKQEILGSDVKVDLSLSGNANFVKGKVTDGKNPIVGATVQAVPNIGNPVTTTTGVYGEYTLNLPSGSYVITASKPGYTSPPGLSVTVGVTVTVGETKSGLDFVLVPDNCQVEGKVTSDGITGIAGVTVKAGDKTVSTDNNGYYQIKLLAGTYWLSASKSGYLSSEPQKLTLNPGETVSGVDFMLVPNASVVTGKVTSAGAPIVWATVEAKGATKQEVTQTDDEGHFSLSIPAGTYDLVASKSGFIPDTLYSISVNPGVTASGKDFQLTQYIGYLRGTVTDGVVPLRKASIAIQSLGPQALSYSTVSDIAGSFIVALLPESSYQVSVSKDGYSSASVETDPIPVGGTAVVSIQLTALPSEIAGIVVDEGGNPIWKAKVKAVKEGVVTSTTTDARGQFRLSLGAGTYCVEAAKPGYLCPAPVEQTLLPGQKVKIDTLALKSNLSAIVGLVKDESTDTGIEGVKIVATENATQTGGTFYSAVDGSFALLGLLSGTYTLILTKQGYVEKTLENLALPGGITKKLGDVLMEPKESSIAGRVEGPAGATVMAISTATGQITYGVTDESGNYLLSHLSSGEYTVKVALNGYSSKPDFISASVSPGEHLTGIDFSLQKNIGFIRGRVYSASDSTVGLRGVVVTADDGLGNFGSATTDADGRYHIENLADLGQQFALQAKYPGYITATDSVSIGTEDADFALAPARRVLKGTVRNQEGTTKGLPEQLKVSLFSEEIGTKEAVTNSQENYLFSFSDLSPGQSYSLWVEIMRKGYASFPQSVSITQQETTFVELTLEVHTSAIKGNVGISGATVTARGADPAHVYTSISQPDGSFIISNVYADTYQITATKPRYVTASDSVTVKMGETKDLGNLLRLKQVEIALIGKVVDTMTNASLADAPVVAVSSDGKSSGADTTDQNGCFRIEALYPETEYTVATTLSPEDYENALTQVAVGTAAPDSIILNVAVHNSSISGKIMEQETDRAIPDAIVTLNDSLSTITDETGGYSFSHLYPGDYAIRVEKPGYSSALPQQVSLGIDQPLSVDPIRIAKLKYTISGTITASGNPVRNAVVRLENSADGSPVGQDTTDQVGAFALSELSPNLIYRIVVTKKGYVTYRSDPIDISAGSQTVDVPLTAQSNTIYGTVFYSSTDQPVEGAVVRAKESSGKTVTDTTDSFGDYALTLPSGLYSLIAQKGSLASPPLSLSGGVARLKDLRLAETARISGQVFYGERHVVSALVVVQNLETGEPSETRSGTDGSYHIRGLLPGAYQISVTASGLAILDSPQQVSLSLGDSLRVDFHGKGISNTFSGICSDERGGPIEGAKILLVADGDTLWAESSADGSFTFENIADGVYSVWARATGYISKWVDEITLANNRPVTRSISLTPIVATISGRVINSKTGEAEGGTVVHLAGPVSLSDTTGAGGEYLFAELTPGNYVIKVQKPFFSSQPDSFTVSLAAGGSMMGLDFLLTPQITLAQLSGTISHGTEPIEGALVIIQTPDLSFVDSTTTDPKGYYEFPDLVSPESYRLHVSAPGFGAATSELIELTEVGARWDFSFPSAQLRFLFTSDGLSPLPGVEVKIRGDKLELTLVSGSNGWCSTPDNLKSGQYQVTVLSPNRRIAPKPWTISLAPAEQRTEEIMLPLEHIPVFSASAADSIKIVVSSAFPYPDIWEIFNLYVKGIGQPLYLPRAMKSEAQGFVSFISPQHRSGQLGYYVKAKALLRRFYSDQVDTTFAPLVYSEESAPHTVEITSEGILAFAELEPKISILSLNGEIILQAHGYDETGTLLDSLIAKEGIVTWELSSASLTHYGAQIEPMSQQPLQAVFKSGQITGEVRVKAKIGLHRIFSVATATVQIKQVSLERIKFLGTVISEIGAGATHRFLAIGEGKTPEGQNVSVHIKPSWAVEPQEAGRITDGLFQPSASYIGPAKVIVSLGQIREELPLSIYQKIAPTVSELSFNDARGFSITFPGGSVRTRTRLSLSRLEAPVIKKYSPRYELHGQVYDLRFSTSNPLEPGASIQIELPLPSGVKAERASVRYWDSEELNWVKIETGSGHRSASPVVWAAVPANILAKYHQYGVIAESEPLKISDLSFTPNPFSPRIGDGLTIRYRLSSNNSRTPFVTIKIYNLTGTLVRTLRENEPQTKGKQIVIWDGLTDSGKEARNGRYLVYIRAKDARRREEIIKPVVLIK